MTNTTDTKVLHPRHIVRLASMSAEELHLLADEPRIYNYDATDEARSDRARNLARGELARREAAGGRQVESA